MKKIYFATTNEGKIKEAKEILGIKVVGSGLEIDEIQSLDPIEVATKKARAYYRKLRKPILVEDVSLSFKSLGGLPATYINDFSGALGNDGLVKLIKSKDRSAAAQTTLVFYDADGEHIFIGMVKGKIAKKPKGNSGFGWDPIFIPNGGTRTFAEMEDGEKHQYSMRAIALRKFKKWLEKKEK